MNRPDNFTLDVRVRERMLARGLLTEKALEQHLGALPDREKLVETLELEQPALVSEKAPPEPLPMLGGLGVPALSPIQSPAGVRHLDPGVGLGAGGRVSPFEPDAKVSPFESGPRVSPFEPAPKVNPFEAAGGHGRPNPQVSAYEPAPRIPAFEPERRLSPYEPAPKVSPFEPAPKVSPFEPAPSPGYGGNPAAGRPAAPAAGGSPYAPAPQVPPVAPVTHTTPSGAPLPAYRQPQQPQVAPSSALPTSPFGPPGGMLPNSSQPVSPMGPSPLVSPFEPTMPPAPAPHHAAPHHAAPHHAAPPAPAAHPGFPATRPYPGTGGSGSGSSGSGGSGSGPSGSGFGQR